MRRYIPLLALLFFLPAQSQVIDNPLMVASAEINYHASGSLSVTNTVNNLEIEIHSVPQGCASPGISYGEVLSDASGSYLFQSYSSRSSNIVWYVTCALDQESEILDFNSLYDFPYSGDYPAETLNYLYFTNLINHSDEVDLLASQIVSGSTSDLEAALRLAAWVNAEIDYDLAYSDTIECATDVFSERRGTCDEFVTLFMSMLRSVGIPVRYVSGYAYGNIYGSQYNSHAWAEVYVSGQWVPMDPTYGEYAFVDALHIPTYYAVDGNQSTIKTRWYPPGEVTIDLPAITHSIYTNDYSDFDEVLSLSVEYSDTELAVDDYVLVTAIVANPTQYYIPTTVGISMTNSTSLAYGQAKNYVLVPPDSEKKRFYIIRIDSCSAPGGYQCINPTEVFVAGGQSNTTDLTVKPWLEPTTSLDDLLVQIQAERMNINTGIEVLNLSVPHVFYSEPTVYVNVRNTGNTILNNLRVVFAYDSISTTVPLGTLLINGIEDGEATMALPATYGERPLSITFLADNLTYQVNSTVHYAEEPNLVFTFIGNTTFHDFEPTVLSVQLSGECYNKSLSIRTPNAAKSYETDSYNYDVELPYDYLLPGTNNLTFSVTCTDLLGTEFQFTDYLVINRVVTGFNIVIYYLLAFGRLLVTLLDSVFSALISFFV